MTPITSAQRRKLVGNERARRTFHIDTCPVASGHERDVHAQHAGHVRDDFVVQGKGHGRPADRIRREHELMGTTFDRPVEPRECASELLVTGPCESLRVRAQSVPSVLAFRCPTVSSTTIASAPILARWLLMAETTVGVSPELTASLKP